MPRRRLGTPTDASAVMVVRLLMWSAMDSFDDSDGPVHYLMLHFQNVRGLPLHRLPYLQFNNYSSIFGSVSWRHEVRWCINHRLIEIKPSILSDYYECWQPWQRANNLTPDCVKTRSSSQWWSTTTHILCSICVHSFQALAKAVRLFIASLHNQQMYPEICSMDIFVNRHPAGWNLKGRLFYPRFGGIDGVGDGNIR